jgi:erythromycin esterase-like protein
VAEALGREVFVIGFTAYGGSVGRYWDEPRELPAALPDSLEDLFFRAGFDNAILDLRPGRGAGGFLEQPIYAMPFGYVYYRAVWGEILDAMMFTREMVPSSR